MNNPLSPLHVTMGWIMFAFIVWLIVSGVRHWNSLKARVDNEWLEFGSIDKAYNRIFNKNRIIYKGNNHAENIFNTNL